ncbi:HAMP domain-containing sensor histidine kinase [Amycolatopsis sp. PS_44_ISF1]|uniref:sensor histidine kinase n=1 Tax=Amycolatopsis sp. PS_44_ISF1 TaxID=2974917 RepID=UPI0028DE6F58|nr:HAMP domain-containing sensor histidine kinase [Amycolatopsis sp. PS_44_ISF1]MDT8909550.1 HAMP domain-containing histidine kinase [Amycolatopsis sp. PS_44_ISF1]
MADPDTRVLRRTRRRIAGQIAVVITLVVLAAGGISYWVLVRGQHEEVDRTLNTTLSRGLSVTPPGCVYLVTPAGHAPSGPLPFAVPPPAPVPHDGDVVTQDVSLGRATFTMRTVNRGGQVSQAFMDEYYLIQDREQLVMGLAVAGLMVLLAAVLSGYLLAGRAIRPLGEALRRQRTFVADASHELRAPLTRLHTRTQLMARRGSASPVLAAELNTLVQGTRELGEVVDDLLLSAQAGGGRPALEPVELGLLAEQAVAAESVRAGEGRVGIHVHRSPDLADVVAGVPTALRRVLSALLDNAIGHTPPGGSIEVTLANPDARHVELRVQDTGAGFAQRDAERLFERFAHGTGGEGRRFGLGLALVHEVVTGHGGTIAAVGAPGAGASFTLRFTCAAR